MNDLGCLIGKANLLPGEAPHNGGTLRRLRNTERGFRAQEIDEIAQTLLVLPGVWHRYHPYNRCGWTESWVEIRGPVASRLQSEPAFASENAVQRKSDGAGLEEALQLVHGRARRVGGGFDPELAVGTLGVLAAWARIGKVISATSLTTRGVIEAQMYLYSHYHEAVEIEALARRVGSPTRTFVRPSAGIRAMHRGS